MNRHFIWGCGGKERTSWGDSGCPVGAGRGGAVTPAACGPWPPPSLCVQLCEDHFLLFSQVQRSC